MGMIFPIQIRHVSHVNELKTHPLVDSYDTADLMESQMILSIVFSVQVSMNFNTSLYSNAIPGISEEYGVSAQAARLGAAIFLITYAFGCELWAVCVPNVGTSRQA